MTRDVQMFVNRRMAGVALARAVCKMTLRPPLTVLGLPRGGVPVAYEVARALSAPLDVMVVRKIGMPFKPELAIGAVAPADTLVREPTTARHINALSIAFQQLVQAARAELERGERTYRAEAPLLELAGRTAVLVDDGLATGCTMLAAVRAARKMGATSIIVAAPVASPEALALVGGEADALAILKTPGHLSSVGEWYERFDPVQDAEVRALLERMRDARLR